MAKAKPQFQTTFTQQSFVENVRTDIRIHCETEALLKKVVSTVNLNEKDFSHVFKSEANPESKKKGLFKKSKQNTIKLIVGVYLNLMFSKAKLDELKEQIEAKEFDQHEIMKFKTSHPDAANMLMDFSKKIPPDRALEFLENLNKSVLDMHQNLVRCTEEHNGITEEYIEKYKKLLNEFDQRLKELNYTLSQQQLSDVFKILGENYGR